MRNFYIRHKIKTGDITHLSNIDGELINSEGLLKEEDIIEVYAPNGSFDAEIVFMEGKDVEVEIVARNNKATENLETNKLVLVQSLSKDSKFQLILEKSVEIGVDEIYPVQTTYSKTNIQKTSKSIDQWKKTIKEATEQSRNPNPTELHPPSNLEGMNIGAYEMYTKICLTSQSSNTIKLKDSLINSSNNYIVAIGPETGWHSDDLDFFKKHNFLFVELAGNILRTETAPIVISSIIKFHQGII